MRPLGPVLIVVFGAPVSTVKVREAGVGSWLPAASVARTSKVWEPSVRFAVVKGEEQRREGGGVDAALEARAGLGRGEGEVGVVSFVKPPAATVPVIVVSGAVVSTVKFREAGVGSTLPAASVARTSKVWEALVRVAVVKGEEHGSEGGRIDAALERRARLRRGEREVRGRVVRGAAGATVPVMVVSGAAVSTVKFREAGVGSMLPRRVGRADLEGVRPSCQGRGGEGRGAGSEGGGIDTALEGRAGLGRGEGEVGGRVVGGTAGRAVPVIVVSGAVVSTEKVRRRRGRIDVARSVGGAHLEGVRPLSQGRGGEGRGAGSEGGRIDAALEGRARLRRGEGEVGVVSLVEPPERGPRDGGVGRGVSTVKVRDAGVASRLPAASVARTANVWEPCVSVPVVKGDVQLVKAAPSTLHWKVAGDSLDENVKAGVVLLVEPPFATPESMVVFGGVVSTLIVREAGVGSVFRRGRSPGPRRCGCRRSAPRACRGRRSW